MAMANMNLIGVFVTTLWPAQAVEETTETAETAATQPKS